MFEPRISRMRYKEYYYPHYRHVRVTGCTVSRAEEAARVDKLWLRHS
jgi:hypothetical protein